MEINVFNDATRKSLGIEDVECQYLFIRKMNVISSGIGTIYVIVIDKINMTLSEIGIFYYSDPLKYV